MHVRRAGGDDHPVELLVLDGLLDGGLARLGARVHEVLGVDDVLEGEGPLGQFGHVDGAGDVAAAVADEDAYPHGFASSSGRRGAAAPLGAVAAASRRRGCLGRAGGLLAAFSAALRSSSALMAAASAMAFLTSGSRIDDVLLQHHVLVAQAEGQSQHLRQVQDGHLVVGAEGLLI